jgi:acetyl-CoA C-acetyltransferase
MKDVVIASACRTATGARIIITLIHALKQKNKNLGLATLCGGGGVSMACAIELL